MNSMNKYQSAQYKGILSANRGIFWFSSRFVNDSYWILYPRSGAKSSTMWVKWWTHISTIKGSIISRKIGEYFDSAQSTGAGRLVYPRSRASSTPRLQVVILLCNDVVPTTIYEYKGILSTHST
jgi:hypothetical protein